MFIDGKCSNCKQKKEYNDSFCSFCFDHNYCSYDYDDKLPRYSFEVAKQLIFDCAAELYHGAENLTKEEIADKLIGIMRELNKMKL